jgi:hypothetical protein
MLIIGVLFAAVLVAAVFFGEVAIAFLLVQIVSDISQVISANWPRRIKSKPLQLFLRPPASVQPREPTASAVAARLAQRMRQEEAEEQERREAEIARHYGPTVYGWDDEKVSVTGIDSPPEPPTIDIVIGEQDLIESELLGLVQKLNKLTKEQKQKGGKAKGKAAGAN